MCILCIACWGCGSEADGIDESPAPVEPPVVQEAEPPSRLEIARVALDSISVGAISDTLLLASMPQVSREWSMQQAVFADGAALETPLADAYARRLEYVEDRACSGNEAMARALLVYGLFVEGEEAAAYFDRNGVDRPDVDPDCADPEVFCKAYEQLVEARGVDAMQRLDQTCERTKLDVARRVLARWTRARQPSGEAAERDLLASLPANLAEYGQQRRAFAANRTLRYASDLRLDYLASRACEGDRAMARSYLRYVLIARAHASRGRSASEFITLPGPGAQCARPRTLCAVMPGLVDEWGEEAIRLSSEVCEL